MAAPLLEIRNLQKRFLVKKSFKEADRVYLKAVDGVDLIMQKGETVGLVGESGCGKSTLGRTILKLHSVSGGQIFYNGTEITNYSVDQMMPYRKKMQLIFQDPFASLNPRKTVFQSVRSPLDIAGDLDREQKRQKVIQMLDVVGMGEKYLNKYPHEMSGGQRQRIVIARALINNPELVVCDEPVSALDVSVRSQVLNLIKDLQEQMNLAYLFISHDLSVVQYICDKVAVMYLGKIVEIADKQDLFAHPLHPYTRSLLSAIPLPDPHYEKQRVRITYNPIAEHDYSVDLPSMREVCPGHFVYCNDAEERRYKEELGL